MNKETKLIALDVDGTLTNEICWTEEDCLHATPRKDVIEKTNQLYLNGNHIIIYTARDERLRNATEYWLRKHGVRFHAINMGRNKMGADVYVDDKAIRPEEL